MSEIVLHSMEELNQFLRSIPDLTNVRIRVDYRKEGDADAGEKTTGSAGTAEHR